MPEIDFNKIIARASYEVQKNIFNRDIKGYEDEVQMATCSVADILFKIEQLENKKDAILSNKCLKSESVGDYSRTFETLGIDNIDIEISNQKEKIKEELKRYLLCTGLLYRGV
jgi:adenine-specific DNA methylase